VDLICEHCLVCADVDGQKVVNVSIVDAVARDLYLDDGNSSPQLVSAHASMVPDSKPDVVKVPKSLTHLTDPLRDSESESTKKEKL
jgi:hypothetical protein